MRTKTLFTALAATAALALTACGGGDPLASDGDTSRDSDAVIVGSADFSESQLLATIYSHALQNAGIAVDEKLNIGSREVYMEALRDGSIDLLPEYNGYLLGELDADAEADNRDTIRTQLETLLAPEGIVVLDEAEAENTDVLVVTPDVAADHDLVTISDLQPIAGELVLAGPAEWKTRFVGLPGLEEVYGLEFKEFKVLDAGGTLTLSALQNGQAQVGDMFSSDPAIEENGLVGLEDDKGLFLPANIVPVIREASATDEVKDVLNGIAAELTTDDLMAMNRQISEGDDIGRIADEWLEAKGL
ncbi:ABC transporter substrate-binding protein [Zhihengliuella halotolerans]|uniref:Osmoprotectant transport system substrate-binding protein n=1 Tax=Zhihengliuella halotolerans TaxID=370736 RepID=A0A4Q8AGN4_9MICC|nr:ABC transporter substrate-binding protein [Zhihengliuella halotolerans]RZU62915.1 osmoprotectant transport system substrate-binding protein [Zhihengliuella halotolerans]